MLCFFDDGRDFDFLHLYSLRISNFFSNSPPLALSHTGSDGTFEGKGGSGTRPVGRPPISGSPFEVTWWKTLGCFASHTLLWRRLASRPEGRYLILEDDASLREGFQKRLETIFYNNLIPDDWDILYLFNFGLNRNTWPPWRGHLINDHIVKLGPAKDNAKNLGTIAYLVRGGSRMLRMISAVRSSEALHIDVSINLQMNESISAYLLKPTTTRDEHGNVIVNYWAGGRGVKSSRFE